MTTTEVATELVLTERHDGVLTITINRPAQRTPSAARSPSSSPPRSISWTPTRRCRWACSPAPVERSARAWI